MGVERGRRIRLAMRVELLYFDGCPSHERLLPTVRRLADEAGAELVLRRVETPEAARAERFLGSPTVRVDGADVDPGAAWRTDYGIKCRIYRVDGEQSLTPPEAWIRSAFARHGTTTVRAASSRLVTTTRKRPPRA
jgi:hypothetical protein